MTKHVLRCRYTSWSCTKEDWIWLNLIELDWQCAEELRMVEITRNVVVRSLMCHWLRHGWWRRHNPQRPSPGWRVSFTSWRESGTLRDWAGRRLGCGQSRWAVRSSQRPWAEGLPSTPRPVHWTQQNSLRVCWLLQTQQTLRYFPTVMMMMRFYVPAHTNTTYSTLLM